MKKLIIVTFLFATGITFSQEKEKEKKVSIQQGTWNIDGFVSVYNKNSDINDDMRETIFSFSSNVGYTIKNNLILGIGLGYSFSDYDFRNTEPVFNYELSKNKNLYGAHAFVKKFIPIKGKFALVFLGELGYSKLYEKNERLDQGSRTTTKIETNTIFSGIRPGITYFITEHFAIEGKFGTLRYEYSESQVNNDPHKSNSNSFYFAFNPSTIYLGVSFYL
ncbi:hypothetical protein [Hanstruepera flava]|uniref:hypothetical protein n=1 Tax=Hanstruepera flava TaxID=2930218 RepID=UPI002028F560|nr:hypothetical protein [Hanstruepera flava]